MTFASFGTVIAKVNLSHINQAFRDPDQEFEVVYYNSSNQKFIGYKYLAIKIVMTADSTAYSGGMWCSWLGTLIPNTNTYTSNVPSFVLILRTFPTK